MHRLTERPIKGASVNSLDVKKLLDAQCGPETARRVSEAFAEVEAARDRADRERELYARTVDALTQPARHRLTTRERDAAAVLGAYFALKRIAADFSAAYSGDKMAQDRTRWLDNRVGGGFIMHAVRNGGGSGELHELFRLAEVLEGLARL